MVVVVVVEVVEVVSGGSVVVVVVSGGAISQVLVAPGVPSSPRVPYVVTDVHQFAMSELSAAGSRSAALAPTAAGSGRDAVHVTRSTGTRSASRSEISSVVSLSGKSESKL